MHKNLTQSIGSLIGDIDNGKLGLPEMQRPFVWSDAKVRDLFDSLMQGFPVGYLMIWACPQTDKTKSIGIGRHGYSSPTDVIIDGQQRLTSLYAVITGKKVLNSKFQEKAIIISYCPTKNKFEVGSLAIKKDPEWIYNISDLFSNKITKSIKIYTKRLKDSRKAKGLTLSEDEENLIDERMHDVVELQKILIPVVEIDSDTDEEAVSEIFVRVNSSGTRLKQNDFILTLMSLYWEDGRRQIEEFCRQSAIPTIGKSTSFNQITDVGAQDIIRTTMAYGFNRGRLRYAYKLLRGADFDKQGAVNEELRAKRFETLKEILPDVLEVNNWHEFLKSVINAGYPSGDLILSKNALFYSYALYLIAKYRFGASYNQNGQLTSLWFFYSALTSVYTGAGESTAESQLGTISRINTLEGYKDFIVSRAREKLTDDYFEITLTGSEGLAVSGKGNNAWNAYVAALNVLDAKVLFSNSSLLVKNLFGIGVDGNRKSVEKHHLFPKAYLKSQGYSDTKINQMANYAYIDWKDNMEILDGAPAEYYKSVCNGKSADEILFMEKENALPHGWENMAYEEFLEERRKLMAARIKEAYEKLRSNIEACF